MTNLGKNLSKINKHIRSYVRKLNIDLKIIQTHNEAKAVSYLHRNRNNFDGMIIIPGVWQKTAYILKDTLDIISLNYITINLGDNGSDNIFLGEKNINNKNILESLEQAISFYDSKQ